MAFPNLPAFGKPLIAVPARGEWSDDKLDLDALAESLATPPGDRASEDLKAAPDMWAQAQVFVDALYRRDHPLHAEAVSQWRGLLALIALAPGATYALDFRPMDLSDGNDDEKAPRRSASSRFRQALAHLPPKARLREGLGDWLQPVLISSQARLGRSAVMSEPQVLGLLNPATLVAPGKAAAFTPVEGAPWMAEGLQDPTRGAAANPENRQGLKPRDYGLMVDYLDRLSSELRTLLQTRQPNRLQARLRESLTAFRQDCLALAGNETPAQTPEPLPEPLGLPIMYRPLLQTARFAGNDQRPADALITLHTVGAPPCKGLILIDEAMERTLGVSAHNIRVHKHHTLSDALQPARLTAIRDEALQEDYLIVRPQDFFVDDFVTFEAGVEIKSHPDGFKASLLPLSPLALLVMTPEILRTRVRVGQSAGGRYRVSLTLDLGGGKAQHEVSQEFVVGAPEGRPTATLDATYPTGLALWPNFHHADWRWHFAKLSYDPRGVDPVPRFATSQALISAELTAQNVGAARAEALTRLVDPRRCSTPLDSATERLTDPSKASFSRLRRVARDKAVEELEAADTPFEAVLMARKAGAGQEARPAGLVLLPQGEQLGNAAGGCTVAIDFGTTNTVAYVKGDNEEQPRRIIFDNRVVFPIMRPLNAASDRETQRWALVEFMPPASNPTPVPTVVIDPDLETDRNPELERLKRFGDPRPLFSTVQFFLPEKPTSRTAKGHEQDAKTLSEIKGKLKFRLKWRTEGVGAEDNAKTRAADVRRRDTAERFLKQFVIMTGAELLKLQFSPYEAQWRFSYPEAMAKRDVVLFNEMLVKVLNDAFGSAEPTFSIHSESLASALYFQTKRPGAMSFIMDIGGATTDVALWHQGNLRWQASFRIAGGDFFTEYIYRNPEFLGSGLELSDLEEMLRQRPKRDLLELFFHDGRFDRKLNDRYRAIAFTYAAGLRQASLIALGGMLYYAGQCVRSLDIPPEDFKKMAVGLGGRGSQIFRLFAQGSSDRDNPMDDLLTLFAAGAGLNNRRDLAPKTVMTDDPKSEVVLGMLNPEILRYAPERRRRPSGDSDQDVRPVSRKLVVGERLAIKGRLEGDQTIEPEADLETLYREDVLGLKRIAGLETFLAALREDAGLDVQLSRQGREDLLAASTEDLRKRLEDARDEIRAAQERRGEEPASGQSPMLDLAGAIMEPPFISELRLLVGMATRDADERRKLLKVEERP